MREPESDTGMEDERVLNKRQGGTETEAGEQPETGADILGPHAVPRNSMQFPLPQNQSPETRLIGSLELLSRRRSLRHQKACVKTPTGSSMRTRPSSSATTKLEHRLKNMERSRDMRAFARAGDLDDGDVQRAMHLHTPAWWSTVLRTPLKVKSFDHEGSSDAHGGARRGGGGGGCSKQHRAAGRGACRRPPGKGGG